MNKYWYLMSSIIFVLILLISQSVFGMDVSHDVLYIVTAALLALPLYVLFKSND